MNKIPENYRPITIGKRVRIVRKDYEPPPSDYLIDVIIERGAFGSGEHETTVSCIEEIIKLDIKNRRVLDIGCGTGILAIVALKLGAKEAVAVDISREAIKTTLENAKLNKVNDKLKALLGTVDKVEGKFDCILANIYPEVLKDIASSIRNRCKKGGFLIISGVPWEDNSEILRIYKSLGFKVMNNRFLESYTTSTLKLADNKENNRSSN